jgi:large subunit ribosomal protein L29
VSSKRFKELKNLTSVEIGVKVRETEALFFQTKMKQATGQLSDTASLWRMRKDIARLKTLAGKSTAKPAVQGSK